jgi:hypothetical protein
MGSAASVEKALVEKALVLLVLVLLPPPSRPLPPCCWADHCSSLTR